MADDLKPYCADIELNNINRSTDYEAWYKEFSPLLEWKNNKWILMPQQKEFSSLRHAKTYMKAGKNRILLQKEETDIEFIITSKKIRKQNY